MRVIRVINVSFQLWGSLLIFILILCLLISRQMRSSISRRYLLLLLLNLLVMLSDLLALHYRGGTGWPAFVGVRVTNFLTFFFSDLMAICFLLFEKAYIEERTGRKLRPGYLRWGGGGVIFALLLLGFNLVYPVIYQIDSLNYYRRLPLFPLQLVFLFVWAGTAGLMLLHYHRGLSAREWCPMGAFLLVPIVATLLSMLRYGLVYSQMGSTACLFAMFFYLHLVKKGKPEKAASGQEENYWS